jgi:hypothetical protein
MPALFMAGIHQSGFNKAIIFYAIEYLLLLILFILNNLIKAVILKDNSDREL